MQYWEENRGANVSNGSNVLQTEKVNIDTNIPTIQHAHI